MKRRVLVGPAEEIRLRHSRTVFVFKRGEPLEVPDDLAAELDARNPEGRTVEEAARYGEQVWADPDAADVAAEAPGEEVGS